MRQGSAAGYNTDTAGGHEPEDMMMGQTQEFVVRNRWTFLIGILLTCALLVAVIDPLTGNKRLDPDNPFWFVGLLVVFAAALTLMAIVFRWLGVENREEAFALPSGSVRTLLAVGVMVLFAFFGLTFFDHAATGGPKERLAAVPLRTVDAPTDAAALAKDIARYEGHGLVALPTAAGKLELYQKEATLPEGVTDMQKQMLTTVGALLTTVLGFYFGSRSAEGARGGGTPAAPVSDGTEALVQDLDEQLRRWKTLLKVSVPDDNAAAFATLRTRLDEAILRLETGRQALLGAPADARGAPAVALRRELEAFKTGLVDAERLLPVG
jgi:hypothetical protein